MSIDNILSSEEFKKAVNYGFYYNLSDEQKQKRLEILKDYNARLTQLKPQLAKKPDLEQSLQLAFSDWRLFTGIVSKVKHLTQLNGDNDYCVLAYDEKTKHIYIAKEIFSGQISQEDFSVFLISQLNKTELSNKELYGLFLENFKRQAEFTKKFLNNRVIPYQLTDLMEALLDGITDEKIHEINNQRMNLERAEIHGQRIQEILQDLVYRKPKNIRNFAIHAEKLMSRRKSFSMYDLTDKLGELGVLNAKMHSLLRIMRENLVEGDLGELQYNYLDFSIISRYLSADGKFCDGWIESETQEFIHDYQRFLVQNRELILQFSEEYDLAMKTGDREQAKQFKDNLIHMREDFSFAIEQDTKNLLQELDSVIERMKEQENP